MQSHGRWTTARERAEASRKRLRWAIDFPDAALAQVGDAPGFVRANTPRAKAFADERGPGYGGGEWPFDLKRAIGNQPFRNGLRKAITSTWAAENWRSAAATAFVSMMSDIIALELFSEQLAAEEREEKIKTSH